MRYDVFYFQPADGDGRRMDSAIGLPDPTDDIRYAHNLVNGNYLIPKDGEWVRVMRAEALARPGVQPSDPS